MSEDEIELSPCGLVRVEWHISDGLMSHVIRSPKLIEMANGQTILSLHDGMWHAEIDWRGGGRLAMSVRHYTRGAWLAVAIDLPVRTFRLGGPGEDEFADEPLDTIDASFRREFERREAIIAKMPRPTMPPRPGERRKKIIDDLAAVAFIAMVGAAVAIWFFERG